MSAPVWHSNAGTIFECEKQPAHAAGGMVVTNHPLGSAAGAEMLAAGGNAVDAAVAALFTLTVVEPMMVGIFGGGMAHIRMTDGEHLVIDGQSTAPEAATSDIFEPLSDIPPNHLETVGRENAVGPKAAAVPGNLMGWCDALARFGKLSLDDVMAPAIRHARAGFLATPYLTNCIQEAGEDLAQDPEISALFLREGEPVAPGTRIVMADYAETLQAIADDGPEVFYRGRIGDRIVDHMASVDGLISAEDLRNYKLIDRSPVYGSYRGFEIAGPPPPSSGGVHVIQMLNVLEGFDMAGLGFGSADTMHLLAEVLKIAFADRAAATADPAFVAVPVEKLIDKDYAGKRRNDIDPENARAWSAEVYAGESANTTHVTVADRDGNIVTTTQTINSLFGARFIFPGTGIIANNYMHVFDPHPGRALSIEPGKRIPSSMSPIIVLADGRPKFALGLPGGLRIFGSAMQTLVNLIDHGMSLQEAVEAPRLWTQGQSLEVEPAYGDDVVATLRRRGHDVTRMLHVGGGMNAIELSADGSLTGAACWRADGTPIGLGGGLARENVRFWPDAPNPKKPT
jgi:gamma-glutamyltranspeptidase/glutathione hydrolase